jgi:hypothetical protein
MMATLRIIWNDAMGEEGLTTSIAFSDTDFNTKKTFEEVLKSYASLVTATTTQGACGER